MTDVPTFVEKRVRCVGDVGYAACGPCGGGPAQGGPCRWIGAPETLKTPDHFRKWRREWDTMDTMNAIGPALAIADETGAQRVSVRSPLHDLPRSDNEAGARF